MEKQEKREMIERALGRRFRRVDVRQFYTHEMIDFDALAEQAIVVPVEVEHDNLIRGPGEVAQKTRLFGHMETPPYWDLHGAGSGHQGNEGKALAIIVHLDDK